MPQLLDSPRWGCHFCGFTATTKYIIGTHYDRFLSEVVAVIPSITQLPPDGQHPLNILRALRRKSSRQGKIVKYPESDHDIECRWNCFVVLRTLEDLLEHQDRDRSLFTVEYWESRARREIAAVAAVAAGGHDAFPEIPGVCLPELLPPPPPPPVLPPLMEPELPAGVDDGDDDDDDGMQFATRDHDDDDDGFQISSSPPTMSIRTACNRISCEQEEEEEGGGEEEEEEVQLEDRVALVPMAINEMRLAGCRGYRAVPANWNSRNNYQSIKSSMVTAGPSHTSNSNTNIVAGHSTALHNAATPPRNGGSWPILGADHSSPAAPPTLLTLHIVDLDSTLPVRATWSLRDVEDAVRALIADGLRSAMVGLRSDELEPMWDEKMWARVVGRARRTAGGAKVQVGVVWAFE